MSKTIEIRLSDAQHAALTAEVEASGQKFFDYCRAKLVTSDAKPVLVRVPPELTSGRRVCRQVEAEAVPAVVQEFADRKVKQESAAAVADPQGSRLDRLEGLMERVLDHLSADRTSPASEEEEDDQPRATGTREDFDTIMARRLADADAQGLTRPQAAPVQELTDDERDYEMVGVRPFRKPGPPAFSVHGTSNRITRERV